MNQIELLAPAGSLDKCKMALRYGADAVYLGGKAFGLRAFAANFSMEEIREACTFAHNLDKKVYVTVNVVPHNGDLPQLPSYLKDLEDAGVDALLVSDLGVWMMARKIVDRKSTRLNSSHYQQSRMPSSA